MAQLVQIAIPTPLYRVFDYRWKTDAAIVRGTRVSVPFGRRQVIGVVLGPIDSTEVPEGKLRSIHQLHDSTPLIPADVMDLLSWASRYYHHPLGEVLASALPGLLRKGNLATIAEREFFRWAGPLPVPDTLKRARVQMQIATYLADLCGKSAAADSLIRISPRWRASLAPLLDRGWVLCEKGVADSG